MEQPANHEESPSAAHETLRRLEERLNRASSAAERLIAEAAAESAARIAGGAGGAEGGAGPKPKPPPAGWQTPDKEPDQPRDLDLLTGVVRSLRDLIPPELQRRLAEALRELLLAVRALIDWYIERLEQRRSAPVEVQDIPIA
jgi:hypothetical protein